MSSIKNHLFEIEEERANEWIRQRLSDDNVDEDSEEWQQLAQEYSDYQNHLWEEAEWDAELKWLKENGSSTIHWNFVTELDALKVMVASNLQDSPTFLFMVNSNIVIKMSYAYAVTLMEAFLSDTLKALITERSNCLENAIKNVEEVIKARYSISELASTDLNICSLVLKKISEILFHNIPKVKKYMKKS